MKQAVQHIITTHNFPKALLEFDVALTLMMNIGLAVFTPQGKFIVNCKQKIVTKHPRAPKKNNKKIQ